MTASFLGGAVGTDRPVVNLGFSLPVIALAGFSFGLIGMILVIGIQAFNPRSDVVWEYPSWGMNPFKLGQPLQFFHFGGYFFLLAGVGALLRWLFIRQTPLADPIVFTFCGAGILAGVWACTQIFEKKMTHAQ